MTDARMHGKGNRFAIGAPSGIGPITGRRWPGGHGGGTRVERRLPPEQLREDVGSDHRAPGPVEGAAGMPGRCALG